MLNILGIGAFHPSTLLKPGTFAKEESLSPLLADCGVESVHTVLDSSYIETQKNVDIFAGYRHMQERPSDLGAKAAGMAIERSAIQTSDIGLFVADVSTPLETCPSEAQRVGALLGLKIPCYDINTSDAAFVLHLNTIDRWRADRVPPLVLSVSTNTPTQVVNYSQGDERFIFGDAAGAAVISKQTPGKLVVLATYLAPGVTSASSISMKLYEHMKIKLDSLLPFVQAELSSLMEHALSHHNLTAADLHFIGPQLHLGVLDGIVRKFGLKPENHWYSIDRSGATLGAGPYVVLAEKWDKIKKGDKILVALTGIGFNSGYALLEGA